MRNHPPGGGILPRRILTSSRRRQNALFSPSHKLTSTRDGHKICLAAPSWPASLNYNPRRSLTSEMDRLAISLPPQTCSRYVKSGNVFGHSIAYYQHSTDYNIPATSKTIARLDRGPLLHQRHERVQSRRTPLSCSKQLFLVREGRSALPPLGSLSTIGP